MFYKLEWSILVIASEKYNFLSIIEKRIYYNKSRNGIKYQGVKYMNLTSQT